MEISSFCWVITVICGTIYCSRHSVSTCQSCLFNKLSETCHFGSVRIYLHQADFLVLIVQPLNRHQ